MKLNPDTPITTRGHNKYLLELRQLSRDNRNNPTEAESKLWYSFLSKRPSGFKFLRQKPINRFILDFYCAKLLLDVEIDGDSHDNRKNYDDGRDLILYSIGIKTLRYKNDSILNNLNSTIEDLNIKINNRYNEL
jgi:very-short-patch-repair endonuclease